MGEREGRAVVYGDVLIITSNQLKNHKKATANNNATNKSKTIKF